MVGLSGTQLCILMCAVVPGLASLAQMARWREEDKQGLQSGLMHYRFLSNPSISLMQTAQQQQHKHHSEKYSISTGYC